MINLCSHSLIVTVFISQAYRGLTGQPLVVMICTLLLEEKSWAGRSGSSRTITCLSGESGGIVGEGTSAVGVVLSSSLSADELNPAF